MSPRLIIQIASDGALSWLLERTAGQYDTAREGSLSELKALLPDRLGQIDVLVPTEAVVVLKARIPARTVGKIRQALPFAVEEHLAAELDDYHLALGQPLGDQQFVVAAVANQQMNDWLAMLDQLPGQLNSLVPDALAIPDADGPQRWQVADRVLVRAGATGLAGSVAEIDAMVAQLALDGEIKTREWDDGAAALAVMADSVAQKPAVNLLQGPFNMAQERADRSWRWLRLAAMVAGVAVSAQMIWQGWQVFQAKSDFTASRAQAEQIYRDAFPGATTVVDPRAQMQQQLAALGSSQASGGFLSLLQRAGPQLLTGQLQVDSMSYREQALELQVRASDLDQIEAVRQQLTARGLSAAVSNYAALGNDSTAQMRIAEVGS